MDFVFCWILAIERDLEYPFPVLEYLPVDAGAG